MHLCAHGSMSKVQPKMTKHASIATTGWQYHCLSKSSVNDICGHLLAHRNGQAVVCSLKMLAFSHHGSMRLANQALPMWIELLKTSKPRAPTDQTPAATSPAISLACASALLDVAGMHPLPRSYSTLSRNLLVFCLEEIKASP